MSRNRRRHTNAMPVSSLAAWIVVAFFLTVAGLSYVYLKNQGHSVGRQITQLESQLAELKTRNEVVRAQISTLSSRTVLQRRIAEGLINMVPITDDRIVRVSSPMAADGIRPVSYEGIAK